MNRQTFGQESNYSFSQAHIEINLSKLNTIAAFVNGNPVQCLIDTGASVNIIDHDWFHANLSHLRFSIEKSRVAEARAANGTVLHSIKFQKQDVIPHLNDWEKKHTNWLVYII